MNTKPEMQSRKLAGNKPSVSTQKYLNIKEIKEGAVILQDGGLRAVVAVSSTNFSLKSEDEQNALVASYQSFLNSINFPVQILIQSRILDIDGYLEKLRGLTSGQTNELLRIQMTEYIEYIGKLVEFANIMSKTFYVIVPYAAAPEKKQGFISRILGALNPAKVISQGQEEFRRNRIKLEERSAHVVSGLNSMGLRTVALGTPELIELMYNSYNFDSASPLRGEELENIDLRSAGSPNPRTSI